MRLPLVPGTLALLLASAPAYAGDEEPPQPAPASDASPNDEQLTDAEPLIMVENTPEVAEEESEPEEDWRPEHYGRGGVMLGFGGQLLSVFGLRATRTQVETGGERDEGYGFMLGSRALASVGVDAFTMRMSGFWFLGGGSADFEGGLGASLTFGVRAPLTRTMGIFGRLGARGYLLGNSLVYQSLLELPELQIGWHELGDEVGLEIAARGGPVLAGRHNVGGSRPLQGSFEYGGFASFGIAPLHFLVEYTRIDAPSSRPKGSPVDQLEGNLCVLPRPWVMCIDGRHDVGRVRATGGRAPMARSTYIGLMLGVGEAYPGID